MSIESIAGIWTGTAQNSNGFDLDITLSIEGPCEVGATCATFDIPAIPCSGTFRLLRLADGILELQVENTQGPCGQAVSDSLQMLSDGTLLYVSRGDGWETRGQLRRTSEQ